MHGTSFGAAGVHQEPSVSVRSTRSTVPQSSHLGLLFGFERPSCALTQARCSLKIWMLYRESPDCASASWAYSSAG